MTRLLNRLVIILCVGAATHLVPLTNIIAQPTLEQLERATGAGAAVASDPQRADQSAPSEPGYLGLMADDQQEAGRGVRVVEVIQGSPAAQAGIAVGDLIVGIHGRRPTQLDAMAEIIADMPAGTKIVISLERKGRPVELEVLLGSRPLRQPGELGGAVPLDKPGAEPAPLPRRRLLGIRAITVSEEIRRLHNLPTNQGALVSEVLVGSPAHRAGIPLDSVIVEASGRPVNSPADLVAAVASAGAGNEIELGFYSRDRLARVKVRLDDEVGGARIAGRPSDPPEQAGPTSSPADRARIESLQQQVRELQEQLKQMEMRLERMEKSPAADAPAHGSVRLLRNAFSAARPPVP